MRNVGPFLGCAILCLGICMNPFRNLYIGKRACDGRDASSDHGCRHVQRLYLGVFPNWRMNHAKSNHIPLPAIL